MKIDTSAGVQVDSKLLCSYFESLVDHFYKILPMRENEEETLSVYTRSLQFELLGCQNLVAGFRADARYLTLLSILQYIMDHPDCAVREVKREVFRAIRICNSLRRAYAERQVPE